MKSALEIHLSKTKDDLQSLTGYRNNSEERKKLQEEIKDMERILNKIQKLEDEIEDKYCLIQENYVFLRMGGLDEVPELFFHVKKTTPIAKMEKIYMDTFRISPCHVLIGNGCFGEHDTPKSLNMKDGDNILVETRVFVEKSSAKKVKNDVVTRTDGGYNVRVITECGTSVYFHIQALTPMREIKEVFAKRLSVPLWRLVFLDSGQRIGDDRTPKQLDFEPEIIDENVIYVFVNVP